jgi:beta-glucosidase
MSNAIHKVLSPDNTPDEQAETLLALMTIEEKVAQLHGVLVSALLEPDHTFNLTRAQNLMGFGAGHLTRVGASSMLRPAQSAELANQLQHFLVEHTRLGIPAIVHEESCAGYLGRGATTFPQAIGMSATWEPDLIEELATVIRRQMRAVGAHHALAPVLDVARDPRWGRLEETFGEDPFLITTIGSAYIHGLQGNDLQTGVIATAKHFLGYGWTEGGRNWSPAHIGERDLREVFLMPFRAAIQEAHIGSVMNAYNELDGVPCIISHPLMIKILREELGFSGVLVSDYGAITTLVNYHAVANTKLEAARMALEAGVDVELPSADCYGDELIAALYAGEIPVALVDTCVRRVLRQKAQLGLFENPYVQAGRAPEVFQTPYQVHLSRAVAQKSLVLLKNEPNLLPLSPALRKIAVIGPSANSVRLLQGDYSYPSHFDDTHLTDMDTTFDPDAPAPFQSVQNIDWTDHFPPSVTVLEGIRALVSPDTEVRYAYGCGIGSLDRSGFAEAVSLAEHSDIAILVVGDKSGLSLGATSGESRDRATLELPGVQQQLIEAIYATRTPIVVVLVNGRAFALDWIAEHVPAILMAWLPGQEGGNAIAETLFGKVSPGGKLPISLPRSVGQLPVYYNHKYAASRSHWHGQYADMPVTPLYPFGHGLSYTHWDYSPLRLSNPVVGATDSLFIDVDVRNTGSVAGDEVVQLYIADPVASVTRPTQALKGFKRISLQPEEQKTVRFTLDVRHTAFYDSDMHYVVEPGKIDLMVGSSCTDIRSRASMSIVGEKQLVTHVFSTHIEVIK